jgi:hypothetical protein
LRSSGVALVLTATFAAWGATPAGAAEQWGPGKHMTQAVGRVMGSVRLASNISDYGYDNGICIMAAFLRPGATVAFNRPLERGERYMILGGGDDDVEDLDIEVLDSSGDVVAKDDKVDAAPVVEFTAPRSGQYTIRQRLYKASVGCFCVVAVLRKGGFDVPIRNLVSASSRLIAFCNAVDRNTSGSVAFHDADNQWAIYGSILRQGEDTTITNITLGGGQRCLLAAGDENSSDIDLFVLDSDGDVIGQDTDADATPIVKHKARAGASYGLRVKNVKAGGATLVLAAILKVSD